MVAARGSRMVHGFVKGVRQSERCRERDGTGSDPWGLTPCARAELLRQRQVTKLTSFPGTTIVRAASPPSR